MIESQLDKLNRLRINAGKTPLKSWKASTAKLQEAIGSLEIAGFIDVLPGANAEVQPVTEDPEIAKALEPPKKGEEKPVTKVKPALARGIDTPDTYTRHSRERVKDNADKDKKKAAQLRDEDKAQVKAEAKLRKGEVDPKKDPEKAERQSKIIEEKRAKRAAQGKLVPRREPEKGEITIADLAREVGKEPKIVRSKLRRPKYQEAVARLRVKGTEEWVFPKSARDELLKIIG